MASAIEIFDESRTLRSSPSSGTRLSVAKRPGPRNSSEPVSVDSSDETSEPLQPTSGRASSETRARDERVKRDRRVLTFRDRGFAALSAMRMPRRNPAKKKPYLTLVLPTGVALAPVLCDPRVPKLRRPFAL